MAKDKYSTKYVLMEINSLDAILSPLKGTQRIKYTCFDVSENFIIFGATSGGIYIFSRDPCHFLQLLPNKDGSLNNVSISPDEKFIGFSTNRGIAAVLERSEEGGAFLISKSEEHGGANVTALSWSDNSNQLFVADDSGQLSVINISLFINKSIFQLPSHVIIKLDSEIFQVSCCGDLLLASTRTRCYICDTVKEQYKQIGTKLREGVFGASFVKYPDGVVKAFCARPGSRLWEVDTDGSVMCTHQFKQALTVNQSVAVSLPQNKLYKTQYPLWQEQVVNFPYLFTVMNKFLFTFKQDAFYVFDPEKVELIAQCNKYSDVVDARCVGSSIYTWDAQSVLKEFILTPVENCLLSLYFRGAYSLCVELCEYFVDYIEGLDCAKLIMLSPLIGLSDHLDNLHLNNNLSAFFVNLNNCCNIQSLKLSLNNSLEAKFKLSEGCDKSNSLCLNNGHIKEASNLVIGSCLCRRTNVDCIHENISDAEVNKINSYYDNNVGRREFLVDNNLSSCISSDSSPEVSLLFTSENIVSTSARSNRQNMAEAKEGTNHSNNTRGDKFKVLEKMSNLKKDLVSLDLIDSDDEAIVAGRETKEKNSLGGSSVDCSSLVNICDIIIKSDNSCKVELFAQFLNKLIVINSEYKNTVVNENKIQDFKMFSLSKSLPEEYVKILSDCFYDIITSGKLVDCLNHLPEEINKSTMLPIKYPNLLLSIHSSKDLELDIALSNIIFMIIDIVDPFIILELIESVRLHCSFMSWYAVVQAFQDNTFDYITVPQDSYKFNDWPLPVILNIIFLMLRLDQVESACYISKEIHINVKNISYLIFRIQLELESSGITDKQCYLQSNKLFLRYLSSLIESDDNLIGELSAETVRYIENAIVQVSSNFSLCHNCHFPVGRKKTDNVCFNSIGDLLFNYYLLLNPSNLCNGKKSTDFNEKIQSQEIILNGFFNFEDSNLYKCLTKRICKDSAKKVIDLIKVFPNIIINLIEEGICKASELSEFIAQFNLINNLDTVIAGFQYSDWDVLSKHFIEISQGSCCICHQQSPHQDEIDWNSFATVMLHSLGTTLSIKILNECSSYVPPGSIQMSFYRSAILSNLMETNGLEGTLFKDVLHSYRSQFFKEPMDSHLSQIGVVSMWEADSNDDSSEGFQPNVVHSKDKKHWGITLDVNCDVCSKCSLVLNSENLLQDGIRSFKCGHTFHVICLRLCNSLFKCSICS